MQDFLLSNWRIAGQYSFWLALALLMIFFAAGTMRRSRNAFVLAGALLPSLGFFLALQPLIPITGDSVFWAATISIWTGLLASVAFALVGIVLRSSFTLAVSAVLMIPFTYYFFGYPVLRWIWIVPCAMLIAAGAVYWKFERRSRMKRA